MSSTGARVTSNRDLAALRRGASRASVRGTGRGAPFHRWIRWAATGDGRYGRLGEVGVEGNSR